jgi:hypothetical protein
MGHFALEVYGKLNATETSSEEKLTEVRKYWSWFEETPVGVPR